MRISVSLISVMTAIALFLSGCTNNNGENVSEEVHMDHGASMDIREETAGIEQMPSFLEDKPDDMRMIYFAAAKHQELLEYMPCYCGCGESDNHKDNYDCFVHENKENGAIVWDDHGTKCGVCLEIAALSIVQYQEGKSMKEIRDEIDQKYAEGYAEPTPTPMPAG